MKAIPKRKTYFLAILCIPLSGCVSHYKPTAPQAATATLVMIRGAGHLGSGSLQEYEAYRDATCNQAAKLGRLSALLTYGSLRKESKIDAEFPVYILARTSIYGSGPIEISGRDMSRETTKDSCSSFLSFIPKGGHRYQLKQEVDENICEITVADLDNSSQSVKTEILDSSMCPSPKL